MVGHPGETEQDFEELKKFVRKARFERMGAFAYSEEEGTYSAKHYKDEIPHEVKQQRLDELMALQQEISAELAHQKIGQVEGGEFLFGAGRKGSIALEERIAMRAFDHLDAPVAVVGSKNWITPAAEQEDSFFPQDFWIVDAVHQRIRPLRSSPLIEPKPSLE